MQRASQTISKYVPVTFKEVVLALILTFAFAFAVFIGYVRVERHESVSFWVYVHYGYPLAWLTLTSDFFSGRTLSQYTHISFVGIVVDFTLYFLLALAIVLGFTKLADYIKK